MKWVLFNSQVGPFTSGSFSIQRITRAQKVFGPSTLAQVLRFELFLELERFSVEQPFAVPCGTSVWGNGKRTARQSLLVTCLGPANPNPVCSNGPVE